MIPWGEAGADRRCFDLDQQHSREVAGADARRIESDDACTDSRRGTGPPLPARSARLAFRNPWSPRLPMKQFAQLLVVDGEVGEVHCSTRWFCSEMAA